MSHKNTDKNRSLVSEEDYEYEKQLAQEERNRRKKAEEQAAAAKKA